MIFNYLGESVIVFYMMNNEYFDTSSKPHSKLIGK